MRQKRKDRGKKNRWDNETKQQGGESKESVLTVKKVFQEGKKKDKKISISGF